MKSISTFNIPIILVLVCLAGIQNPEIAKAGFNQSSAVRSVQNAGAPVVPGIPVSPREFNGDLRNLPQIKSVVPHQQLRPLTPGTPPRQPASSNTVTPSVQSQTPAISMPSPTTSFAGLNLSSNGSGWPPDTNGDVGPNYYIQAVNTSIGIFNKTGTLQTAFTFDSFWSKSPTTGTACDANNQGDPIVLYDPLADRWIFADMAWTNMATGPFYECFAVSKTSDPVNGGWWKYAVRTDDSSHTYLADYPKLALWPDGIYMSANEFRCSDAKCSSASYEGVRVWAFNRAKMESGSTLQSYLAKLGTSYFGLLPGNLRGASPPSGTPNYFVALDAGSTSKLDVWKFHVDWATPANSTLTGPTLVSIASYTDASNISIPEQGGENLDSLGDRLMMQNQYRNINGTESLWLTHTVGSGGVTGIRWYQLNVTGGKISGSPVQSSTYQPNANYRWMPSLAVDKFGNMAVGYSVSSSTMHPAIAYSGRLATDPLNTLGQGETTLIAGTGSQNGGYGRWGDYTAMTVDPTDDCTFWYTNEYYSTTGSNWLTRIGSFKFPACATFTISGNVGAGGVTLGYTDTNGTTRTVTSATDGSYSLSVSYNWSGTVTPSKTCYTFNPASLSYSNVTTDQTNQDYTPTLILGCGAGPGKYDDADTGWTYSGPWKPKTGKTGPYLGTLHISTTLSDSASFAFSGTQFVLFYTKAPNRGKIQVFLDGSSTPLTTLNAYSSTITWQARYKSPVLSPGTHTVVFQHGGPSGKYIDIDAIKIIAKYDDADTTDWSYTGSWTPKTGKTGPYQGTFHITGTPSDSASFTFSGTQFVFFYTKASNRGIIQVFLDGSSTPLTTLNAYNSTIIWKAKYKSPVLSTGTHTVVFEHGGPSGSRIDIDAIKILQ